MIKLRTRYKAAGDVFKELTDRAEWDIDTAAAFLENIPDANVEEVVRCKDCKHSKPKGKLYECPFFDEIRGDEFCSSGEPKEATNGQT